MGGSHWSGCREGESTATGLTTSVLGFGECYCWGTVTLGGWPTPLPPEGQGGHDPPSHLPFRAFPDVPEPVRAQNHSGNAPGGGQSPSGGQFPTTPPPVQPTHLRTCWGPPPPRRRRGAPEGRAIGGVRRNGRQERSARSLAQPDLLPVLIFHQTAWTPPI